MGIKPILAIISLLLLIGIATAANVIFGEMPFFDTWLNDKSGYYTSVQVDNATIIRVDNATWIRGFVGNATIIRAENTTWVTRLVNVNGTDISVSSINASRGNFTNITALRGNFTNITAERINASLDCHYLTGGSDTDYCADDIGGGGAGGTAKSGAQPYLYNDTNTIYFNSSYANLSYGNSYFFNKTSFTINGNFTMNCSNSGGYSCGNKICSTNFTGTHMCQEYEIIATYAFKNASNITNFNGYLWYSSGAPKYVPASLPANDCNGWNSSMTSTIGNFWDITAGYGKAGYCDGLRQIACCKSW